MRRSIIGLACILIVVPLMTGLAVVGAAPAGDIRVLPSINVKFQTPVHFSVETIGDDPIAYDPIVFLVMTEESYGALTGGVEVAWGGGGTTFPKASFTEESNNDALLPPGAAAGLKYLVTSLKDQLGTSGPIYWASGPFLGDVVTRTPEEFTVTLHSLRPNMLVYVLGKSDPALTEYDMRSIIVQSSAMVPEFYVPEPATIIGIGASMAALAGYAAKKRKWI